jgi:hypothetical protein
MPDLVDLSNDQFLSAWRLFAQACSGFAEGSARGVRMVFAGVPVPFFNVALMDSEIPSEDELRLRADGAAEWAHVRTCPWFLVLCHESLPESLRGMASDVLSADGFQPALSLTGMLAGTLTPARREAGGLELRLATDQPLRNARPNRSGVPTGAWSAWPADDPSPARPPFTSRAIATSDGSPPRPITSAVDTPKP